MFERISFFSLALCPVYVIMLDALAVCVVQWDPLNYFLIDHWAIVFEGVSHLNYVCLGAASVIVFAVWLDLVSRRRISRGEKKVFKRTKTSFLIILFLLMLLCIASVFFGAYLEDYTIGFAISKALAVSYCKSFFRY